MAKYLSSEGRATMSSGLSKGATPDERRRVTEALAQLGYIAVDDGSDLTADEWRTIHEGFARGATKSKKAARDSALAKAGFVSKAKAKNKPGRAKKSTTNPVDEELRRLITNIRAQLGISTRRSKAEALQIVCDVFENANEIFRTYLFFTTIELQTLRRLRADAEKISDSVVQEFLTQFDYLIASFTPKSALETPQSILSRFDNLIASFQTENAIGGVLLDELVFEADSRLRYAKETGASSSFDNETDREIYARLASSLGLDVSAMLKRPANRITVVSEADELKIDGHPMDVIEEPDQFRPVTFAELEVTRAEILRTASARLAHLRLLFVDSDKGLEVDVLDGIYRFLKNMSWSEPPSETTTFFDTFWTLLLDACHRQGLHPFSNLTYPFLGQRLEDLYLGSEPVFEGEPSTGGYLDTRRLLRLRAHAEPPSLEGNGAGAMAEPAGGTSTANHSTSSGTSPSLVQNELALFEHPDSIQKLSGGRAES